MHFAAQYGKYDICKFIIETGEDPNPLTNNGTSVLDLTSNEEIRNLICQKLKEDNTQSV